MTHGLFGTIYPGDKVCHELSGFWYVVTKVSMKGDVVTGYREGEDAATAKRITFPVERVSAHQVDR